LERGWYDIEVPLEVDNLPFARWSTRENENIVRIYLNRDMTLIAYYGEEIVPLEVLLYGGLGFVAVGLASVPFVGRKAIHGRRYSKSGVR
jgi:hypothetical protein